MNPVASDNSSFSPWTALWIEVIPILQELTVFFIDRQNPVKSCENGTQKIPILVPGKNENCQWLVELLQFRSQIGSKTQDNEIECQKEQGKFSTFLQTMTKMRPIYFMPRREKILKDSLHNYQKCQKFPTSIQSFYRDRAQFF